MAKDQRIRYGLIAVCLSGVLAGPALADDDYASGYGQTDETGRGAKPALQNGTIPRVDQRDPNYQRATERLARAQHLIDNARAQLAAADRAYPLPGFNATSMGVQLGQVSREIEPLLTPERRRLEYETLTPSADFIAPGAPSPGS